MLFLTNTYSYYPLSQECSLLLCKALSLFLLFMTRLEYTHVEGFLTISLCRTFENHWVWRMIWPLWNRTFLPSIHYPAGQSTNLPSLRFLAETNQYANMSWYFAEFIVPLIVHSAPGLDLSKNISKKSMTLLNIWRYVWAASPYMHSSFACRRCVRPKRSVLSSSDHSPLY